MEFLRIELTAFYAYFVLFFIYLFILNRCELFKLTTTTVLSFSQLFFANAFVSNINRLKLEN